MGSGEGSVTRFVQATAGLNAGCTYPLGKRSILGRGPTAHVQVMDPLVSREHACLEQTEEGHTVLRDLRSANGTFVGGRRITERRIRSGDTFRIGTSEFVFGEVRGDIVDMDALPRTAELVSSRARQATTLVAEALKNMRKKLTVAEEQLKGESLEDTVEEGCGDPLHGVAVERGWTHCPACGERTGR